MIRRRTVAPGPGLGDGCFRTGPTTRTSADSRLLLTSPIDWKAQPVARLRTASDRCSATPTSYASGGRIGEPARQPVSLLALPLLAIKTSTPAPSRSGLSAVEFAPSSSWASAGVIVDRRRRKRYSCRRPRPGDRVFRYRWCGSDPDAGAALVVVFVTASSRLLRRRVPVVPARARRSRSARRRHASSR